MTAVEIRARRAVRWASGDDGARWAFRAMLVATVGVYYVIGRHQWFTRDDWGYVLHLEDVLANRGWQEWFFSPQEGHWLSIPIVIFHLTKKVFDLGSYWPFLIPTMLAHVAAVLLTRAICRRLGVSAWTATLVCSMLLVFGSGWDNIVFAIQICYNLSLVCFLAQVLLVDHDGPPDRRDAIGSGLALIGVMSSGFGPIFVVGVFALLTLRRRWRAVVIACGPAAVAYGWWLLAWWNDQASESRPGNRAELPAYVTRGVTATFESIVAIPTLAGVALLATLGVAMWRGIDVRPRTAMLAMWCTVVVMFAAIGFERIGFGVPTAASSRYLHMSAIVIAPAFALAVDQLRRIAPEARWAGRAIVLTAIAINASLLRTETATWAIASRAAQDILELVSGSPESQGIDPTIRPIPLSPNVTLQWIPELIRSGAIHPRQPVTPEEIRRVRVALGLQPP